MPAPGPAQACAAGIGGTQITAPLTRWLTSLGSRPPRLLAAPGPWPLIAYLTWVAGLGSGIAG